MLQGSDQQLVEYIQNGQADIALIMEYDGDMEAVAAIPLNQWEYCLVVPNDHPLAQTTRPVTLEEMAHYPLITYEKMFSGRKRIERVFMQHGFNPEIRGDALSAEIIKTYVKLGVGIGLIVEQAYDKERDKNLHAISVGHLFGAGCSHILIRKNHYLRGYAYAFLELLSPFLNRRTIEQALSEKDPVKKISGSF